MIFAMSYTWGENSIHKRATGVEAKLGQMGSMEMTYHDAHCRSAEAVRAERRYHKLGDF